MNKIVLQSLNFLLLIPLNFYAFSQKIDTLPLTYHKTVHVFFPENITYYDIGINEILAVSNENMLKLAPKYNSFEETNLTIITKNNKCYSFILNYKPEIDNFLYFIDSVNASMIPSKNQLEQKKYSKAEKKTNEVILENCKWITKQKPLFWDIGRKSNGISIAVNGIFTDKTFIYLLVSLGNATSIPYEIEFMRVFLNSKKKLNKSPMQEKDLVPEYIFNNITQISPQEMGENMVLVFNKFTLDKNKKMGIELFEKDGNRNVQFEIHTNVASKAVMIP